MDVCRFLDWDSKFFNLRIARVNSHTLDLSQVKEVNDWCASHKIDCLYFLASSNEDKTICLAEENGFHQVDVRVTLDRILHNECTDQPKYQYARLFQTPDYPVLRHVARTSYTDSRFFYDDHFDRTLSEDLYEVWLQKSCLDSSQAVLVIEYNDQPAGFITCQVQTSGQEPIGMIGLVGIAESARGKEIGKALVKDSLQWFSFQSLSRVEVVTQGRNIHAQRLYQSCGFKTCSIQLWYHKWFNKDHQ